MNFAQYMAARGIKGAAGAMPEIYRQAGLQGQIGALDRQEAANLAAIERQRSNVESGYALMWRRLTQMWNLKLCKP